MEGAKRLAFDEELVDAFSAIFHDNFRAVKVVEPCKWLTRYGSGVGKRKLSATFGVTQTDAEVVLLASGQTGIVSDFSNMGA